jgi:predicted enzyme related to lactoylglutathione lyase
MGFTELSSTDSAATRSFLEKAFRWKFAEVQMPNGQYLSYKSPDGNTLGIRPVQQFEAPNSMNYVRVEDLKLAETKVLDAGGKIILPRTDIPEMGSFFWFKIPSGPLMACWQDAPKPTKMDRTRSPGAGKRVPF